MVADKSTIADKPQERADAGNHAAVVSALGNVSLKECRDAATAMQPACTAALEHVTIANAPAKLEQIAQSGTDRSASSAGESFISNSSGMENSKSAGDNPHISNGMVVAKETMTRSQTAIKNTAHYLTSSDTTVEDKLKSAGVLAANGIKELKGADGTDYKFGINEQNVVNFKATDSAGHTLEINAKLSADGGQILKASGGAATDASGSGGAAEKSKGAYENSPVPMRGDQLPPQQQQAQSEAAQPTGKDALFDPSVSQEDKLKAAREMADHGQKRFKGPDGKDYEISTHNYGNKEAVTIFQNDGKGHAHVMMRGLVDDKGNVTQQHDGKGKSVDIEGDWAKKNGADSTLLRHDEKKADKTDKTDKTDDAGDKTKLQGTPEELKQLDASRERLKNDATQNIENPQDRDRFNKDMESFEQRAKTQPLSAREVSETYDQLSKLMEAKDGAVAKPERVLAAETFAHHMGDPTNIDQGQHDTCNVTSLEEHLITRNPAKAAEIVSTMAVTGHWTAPDGKDIKITPGSLVPGAEERKNPPDDGARSYATQLMNLALINDRDQRKIPPEFYSQERPSGQGDFGERLKYADGSSVRNDDVLHNGDKTPFNAPNLRCEEISREGQSINGDGNFVIANGKVDDGDGVVKVNNADDLRHTLEEMKAGNKFPAIIMVDSHTAAFGGDPSQGPGWHVVSITGYDETTGKAHISNQWGRASDRDMSVDDLYRSTYTN